MDTFLPIIKKLILRKLYLVIIILNTNGIFSFQNQKSTFTSSNLPIIVVNTNNQTIIDEPKIDAHMGIIYNGEGNLNYLTDPFNDYDGFIGIELRGFSSSGWSEKKPYGIETRDELGENNNVSLLGLPKENDWVLHSPQADKTLIRNKFIYDIAREMGMYAPKSRFCELVIDGDYRGVYVLIEKIKKDKNRVNITKADEINPASGYLIEMTPKDRVKEEETSFITDKKNATIVVKYPDESDITSDQLNYIRDYFNEFESTLFSNNFDDTTNGYSKNINVDSFINHILLSECFHQLDGLYASQYFHKKKDGKLTMGPVWDFNRSMGNVQYYNIYEYDMWWMLNSRGNRRIPYVNQLMTDKAFMKRYAERWFELRENLLQIDNVYARIDSYAVTLKDAKDRNFERWPEMLHTSYSQYYVFDNYDEYITQMKVWINNKFLWLDTAFEEYKAGVKLSDDDFKSFPFEAQYENFIVEFDWSPQNDNMDGVFALADISNIVDAYNDLACITRLNRNGEIDVRSAGTYINDINIDYKKNEYYHITMEVNVTNHKYNVYVTPVNTGLKTKIASNYAFRSDQSNVEKLNGFVTKSSSGSYKIKNFCLNNECNDSSLSVTQNDLTTKTLKSYPNPFSKSITFNLEQTYQSNSSINIYTINGKLVKNIYNGILNRGNHKFTWNGKDSKDSEVTAGVYLCRYISEDQLKTMKIIKF